MNSMKVFIVKPSSSYREMFLLYGWDVVDNLEEADLVLFTGGADVDPSFYGEDMHPATKSNIHRDRQEAEIYLFDIEDQIPCAGICRGGQFLNVMNGGKMYQHVDGHAILGTHEVKELSTGDCYQVSSTHHQMMRPAKDGDILVVGWESSFKEYVGDDVITVRSEEDYAGDDVEVVVYRDTKCLCFQPHPEFVVRSKKYRECADLFFRCLDEIL